MIRLTLIDDHGLIRQGLKALLNAIDDMEVIADTSSLDDAMVSLHDADVVLINLRHLSASLLPQLQSIKSIAPQTALLVMADTDQAFLAAELLRVGVLGYVGKQSSEDELVAAIRKVAKGTRHVPADLARQWMLQHMTQPNKASSDNPFLQLAKRELLCVQCIAQGLDTLAIAEKMAVSSKTINTYRHRIFQKLQVSGDVELIKLALRYRLLDDIS